MTQWAPPDAPGALPATSAPDQIDPNAMGAVTTVTKAFGDVVAVSDAFEPGERETVRRFLTSVLEATRRARSS